MLTQFLLVCRDGVCLRVAIPLSTVRCIEISYVDGCRGFVDTIGPPEIICVITLSLELTCLMQKVLQDYIV